MIYYSVLYFALIDMRTLRVSKVTKKSCRGGNFMKWGPKFEEGVVVGGDYLFVSGSGWRRVALGVAVLKNGFHLV